MMQRARLLLLVSIFCTGSLLVYLGGCVTQYDMTGAKCTVNEDCNGLDCETNIGRCISLVGGSNNQNNSNGPEPSAGPEPGKEPGLEPGPEAEPEVLAEQPTEAPVGPEAEPVNNDVGGGDAGTTETLVENPPTDTSTYPGFSERCTNACDQSLVAGTSMKLTCLEARGNNTARVCMVQNCSTDQDCVDLCQKLSFCKNLSITPRCIGPMQGQGPTLCQWDECDPNAGSAACFPNWTCQELTVPGGGTVRGCSP
ncbi:MAG: hypothetical protein EP343_15495 [Deltaproteobacteria bacterium]|nr:MAG: hypothetical protein EP343_15495 [Deltaproteobacteria bacterium]